MKDLSRAISELLRTQVLPSLAVILGMILAGLLLWDRLPTEMAVHFDFSGQPDDYAPKAFVVFGMPLILAGLQLVCSYAAWRPAPDGFRLPAFMLWIIPATAVVVFVLLYQEALGGKPDVRLWCELPAGVLLIILGNFFPKSAGSLRLGKYTRRLSPAGRQRIARFWGYCLVWCGIAMVICALAGGTFVFMGIAAVSVVLPWLYTLQQICGTAGT